MAYTLELYLNNDSLEKTYTELFDVSLSSHKAVGTSMFLGQPLRATISLFNDDWLYPYLFTQYKNENYGISTYTIKLYYDSNIIFSGFINTSTLKHSKKTGIVTINAYDFSFAFNFFTEPEYVLTESDNEEIIPSIFFSSYRSRIESGLNIDNISVNSIATFKPYLVTDEHLYTVPHDIIDKFIEDNPPNLYGKETGSYNKEIHYDTLTFGADLDYLGQPLLVIGVQIHYYIPDVSGTDYNSYVNLFKVWQCYNYSCWEEREDLEYIAIFDGDGSTNNAQDAAYVDFTDHRATFNINGSSPETYTITSGYGNTIFDIYEKEHWKGFDIYPYVGCSIKINGNIIKSNFQVESVPYLDEWYKTNYYRAFKAMLVYYGYYIFWDQNNTMVMGNKGTSAPSSYTSISRNSIVTFETSTLDLVRSLDVSELDYLKGDSTELKRIITAKILDEYANLVSIKLVVDDISAYDLSINNYILNEIDGNYYKIVELQTDRDKDEYTLIGWGV